MVWLESGRVPMPWSRTTVAFVSGHKPGTGYFNAAIGRLKRLGLVSWPAPYQIVLEQRGRELAIRPKAPLTMDALHACLLGRLNQVQTACMLPIIARAPEPIPKMMVAAIAQVKQAALLNALSQLRACGAILADGHHAVQLHPDLAPEALI
jgi:hypothetical protein